MQARAGRLLRVSRSRLLLRVGRSRPRYATSARCLASTGLPPPFPPYSTLANQEDLYSQTRKHSVRPTPRAASYSRREGTIAPKSRSNAPYAWPVLDFQAN